MATNVTCCTFCDPPVPAAKTCLRCEASMCREHLKVHSQSEGHILVDPVMSLESRKCSIHDQIFKYYCTEEALCICVRCCHLHELQHHPLQTTAEASEKVKGDLRNVHEKLSLSRDEKDKEMQKLEEYMRRLENDINGFSDNITTLFLHTREQLDLLEKLAQSQIRQQREKVILPISDLIQTLETRKDELSTKMRHIEELCLVTDPITVLQKGKKYTASDVDLETAISRRLESVQKADEIDKGLVYVTLYKGFSETIRHIKNELCTQEKLLLDVKTAGEYIDVSSDLTIAKSSEKKISRPKTSDRFQYSQILSVESFWSGRHFWEVETSDAGNWRLGVCYPSISRKGELSYLGDNGKSWCLGGCNKLYTVMHNKKPSQLYQESAVVEKIAIYLDYEAGRLSFYELGDTIRLLHTFSATFTEPLHAAFGVWNSSFKILS